MQRYSCLFKHPRNCTFSDTNSKEETQTVRNPHTQTSASAIYIFFTTWMQSLEIKSSSDKSFYLYYLAWFLIHRDIYWTRPNVGSEELAIRGLHSLKIHGLGRLREGKHMSRILHSFLDSNTLRNPTLTSMCYCYHKCYMHTFNLQQSYQSIPACQEQVEERTWNPVLNNGLEKEMLEILRNLSLLYKRKTGGQSSLLAALLTESGVLCADSTESGVLCTHCRQPHGWQPCSSTDHSSTGHTESAVKTTGRWDGLTAYLLLGQPEVSLCV